MIGEQIRALRAFPLQVVRALLELVGNRQNFIARSKSVFVYEFTKLPSLLTKKTYFLLLIGHYRTPLVVAGQLFMWETTLAVP